MKSPRSGYRPPSRITCQIVDRSIGIGSRWLDYGRIRYTAGGCQLPLNGPHLSRYLVVLKQLQEINPIINSSGRLDNQLMIATTKIIPCMSPRIIAYKSFVLKITSYFMPLYKLVSLQSERFNKKKHLEHPHFHYIVPAVKKKVK